MADLKVGTTIGGSPAWNQANLPLIPSGPKILYKGARVYSESDKPTADELQMVSRLGDTMSGRLTIEASNEYPIELKSNTNGSIFIRHTKNNVLQAYSGTDQQGNYKVSVTNDTGAWAFDGLKIDKANGEISFNSHLKSNSSSNFDIKYRDIQFIRANSSKNVYIGAPGGTDVVLGYNQDGMTTQKIRIDAALTSKTGRLLVSDTGFLQRAAMDFDYYSRQEGDDRYIRQNVNYKTNAYLLTKSVSYDAVGASGVPTGYSGFYRNNSSNGFAGLTVHVAHPSYDNGAYSRGITFDYGGSNRLYTYALDASGNKLGNQKIYTEADKPTPGEIGALAETANAVSASKLVTGRRISLGGDASGSVVFDGSGDVTIPVVVNNDSHEHSLYVKKSGDTMAGDLTVNAQINTIAFEVGNTTHKARLASANGAVYFQMGSLATASDNSVVMTGWNNTNLDSIGFRMADTKSPYVEWAGVRKSIFHRGNSPTLGSDLGLQWSILSPNGTSRYVRLATLGLTDTDITFILSGFGDHGSTKRATYNVTAATHTSGISVDVNALDVDMIYGAKPIIYHRRVNDAFEIWVKTPSFNLDATFTRMSGRGSTVNIDSTTTTEPTGLTEVTINQIYTTRFKPTPSDVGALPVGGNAVSATRLQTARLISGVPFDGSSNITISASNVGALPITGGTLTGNLSVNGGTITSSGIIRYYNSTTNLGLALSANPNGYAEIVRTANNVDEWNEGLRSYGGTDWRIGSNRIYNQGFKPTPTEIGAYTKAETDGLIKEAGSKTVTVTKPTGIADGQYVPVVLSNMRDRQNVYISTKTTGGGDPMNNCAFNGIVRSGGWSDMGNYVVGEFTIHQANERALHSVQGGSESDGIAAFYVHEKAFPITLVIDGDVVVTTGAVVSVGTSRFVGQANPSAESNTKARLLADFASGNGFYRGSSLVAMKPYVDTELDKKFDKSGGTVTGNTSFSGEVYIASGNLRVASTDIVGVASDVVRLGDGSFSRSLNLNAKNGEVYVQPGATKYRVYHQGFKPTANDVGALALTGGTVASIIDNTTNIGKTALSYQTITSWANPCGTSLFVTPASTGVPSAAGGGYWHTLGRRDNGAGYAGLLVDYGNPRSGVWIGKNDTGANPIWQRVYTDAFKPTAADVGALPITGGTLTGMLTGINAEFTSNLTVNGISTLRSDVNIIGQLVLAGSVTAAGNLVANSGFLRLQNGGLQGMELHAPGVSAAMIYHEPGSKNINIASSNGAGGAIFHRASFEPNGNFSASGAINSGGVISEVGVRVYSPNNPPPAKRLLNTAQIGGQMPTNQTSIPLSVDVRGHMGMTLIESGAGKAYIMFQWPPIDCNFNIAQGSDHSIFQLRDNGRTLQRIAGWGEAGPWEGFWIVV